MIFFYPGRSILLLKKEVGAAIVGLKSKRVRRDECDMSRTAKTRTPVVVSVEAPRFDNSCSHLEMGLGLAAPQGEREPPLGL